MLGDGDINNPQFVYVKLGGTWGPHSGNDGGFILQWSAKDIGFGEIAFYKKDGQVYCDSEAMSDNFVRAVMNEFIKNTLGG